MPKNQSSYPGSIDSELQTDRQPEDIFTSNAWDLIEDAIHAIETELGTDPAGASTDVKTRLGNVTAAELSQLETMGATTISAAQWGYLGACGAGGGQLLAALTTGESDQLELIGATTISNAQWGYLGDMNLGISIGNVPAFLANADGTQINIAEAGPGITVQFPAERFDIGANFAANVFTAPITGKYLLAASLYLDNADSASTTVSMTIATTLRTYYAESHPDDMAGDDTIILFMCVVCDMTAGNTALITIDQVGGADQMDINAASYFSGVLVA